MLRYSRYGRLIILQKHLTHAFPPVFIDGEAWYILGEGGREAAKSERDVLTSFNVQQDGTRWVQRSTGGDEL